jgi:Family of unknown function (DUF5832)
MPRETLPKTEDDGHPIDYLEEDPEVPTQRYCIISFISPEKVIKQRNEYFNEKFVEWLDYDWKITGMETYNAFLSKKYSLKIEDLFADFEEFRKIHNDAVKKTDIHEKYQVFLLKHEKELDSSYSEKVDFQTNVRGVKVRRVFASVEEAQNYAKIMQRRYPRDNLYVGKVGCWLPWDPSEHVMPEVEYAEQELNELMRKYKENEANREMFFEEEKAEKIKNQRIENEKRKAKVLEDSQETKALKDSLETPIHPSEGGIRD